MVFEGSFTFCQCIFAISQLSSLIPSFGQTCFPITQGCSVPSLIEIGPVVLSKKIKMWKIKQEAHWPFRSSEKTVLFNKLMIIIMFWRRRFLNFINVFLLFGNYFPFEKGGFIHYTPREQSSGGYIEIILSVRLSVCPSVCADSCPAHNFFMV